MYRIFGFLFLVCPLGKALFFLCVFMRLIFARMDLVPLNPHHANSPDILQILIYSYIINIFRKKKVSKKTYLILNIDFIFLNYNLDWEIRGICWFIFEKGNIDIVTYLFIFFSVWRLILFVINVLYEHSYTKIMLIEIK